MRMLVLQLLLLLLAQPHHALPPVHRVPGNIHGAQFRHELGADPRGFQLLLAAGVEVCFFFAFLCRRFQVDFLALAWATADFVPGKDVVGVGVCHLRWGCHF